jgi:hypothetical protein
MTALGWQPKHSIVDDIKDEVKLYESLGNIFQILYIYYYYYCSYCIYIFFLHAHYLLLIF